MKRLRHPVRAIREPFGTAGLIVAVVALVLALGGAAFAAAKLNSTQKKEVEKIAKKFAGKPGAPGAQGQAGPEGKAGATGPEGLPGTNGKNGKSVTVANATNGECEEGGATVEVEGAPSSKKKICNGSPWTVGGTLPSGQTETGAWGINMEKEESGFIPISFPIQLASRLEYHSKEEEENHEGVNQVHFIVEPGEEIREEVKESESTCLGTVTAPSATKGNLCVYLGVDESRHFGFANFRRPDVFGLGTGVTGTDMAYQNTSNSGGGYDFGTWAVTAP